MNISQARQIKQGNPHGYYDREGNFQRPGRTLLGSDSPHIPNKNEAKALRRLKAKTGLTEVAIRAVKKYRQELAQAAGPQFKTHERIRRESLAWFPWTSIKDPVEHDKAEFAFRIHLSRDSKHFERLYAEELRRRKEADLIAFLSKE